MPVSHLTATCSVRPRVAVGRSLVQSRKTAHYGDQILRCRALPVHVVQRAQQNHNLLAQTSFAQGHALGHRAHGKASGPGFGQRPGPRAPDRARKRRI